MKKSLKSIGFILMASSLIVGLNTLAAKEDSSSVSAVEAVINNSIVAPATIDYNPVVKAEILPDVSTGSLNVSSNTGTDFNSTNLVYKPTTVSVAALSTVPAENVISGTFGANTGGGNYTFPANVNITGNLALTNTSVIYKNGVRFLHAYGYSNVFLGSGSGNLTMTGGRNTAVGSATLSSNTSGSHNTAIGWYALYYNTTGSYNTANGREALYSNTTGSYNTANGMDALFANTTGSLNTANGMDALFSNTTGNSNTANGLEALFANTTGNSNTANGEGALYFNTTGSYNTANGFHALLFNTTGGDNTAYGSQALSSNTSGSGNTALGLGAGAGSIGSNNVFIGYNAGYNETGSNKLYINNDSSGALIYGDFASDKVGINTTNPDATLRVNGSIKANSYYAANGNVGLSNTYNLKASNGQNCAMTFSNGLLTASTCS